MNEPRMREKLVHRGEMLDVARALLADEGLSLDLSVEVEELRYEQGVVLRLAASDELRHALGLEPEPRKSLVREKPFDELWRDRPVRRDAHAPLPPLRNPLLLVYDREQRVRVAEPLDERRPRAWAADEERVWVHAATLFHAL